MTALAAIRFHDTTPESRGKKRKGLLTPVSPLYPIPRHRPYCAIVPVVVVPDELVVVRAAVVVCSVVAIVVVPAAVVPAAVVPAAQMVSESLDAPPGLVMEVVNEPVSTYTPLKYQSSAVVLS